MKWYTVKIFFLLAIGLFVNYSLSESAPKKTTEIKKVIAPFPPETVTRITIVGDTGTGERAYPPGFSAVQKAMRETMPDALLHLGDSFTSLKCFPTPAQIDI
jgi:hypothetical protein